MMLEMTYENEKVLIFGIEQGYTYEVLTSVKNKYNIQTLYFWLCLGLIANKDVKTNE